MRNYILFSWKYRLLYDEVEDNSKIYKTKKEEFISLAWDASSSFREAQQICGYLSKMERYFLEKVHYSSKTRKADWLFSWCTSWRLLYPSYTDQVTSLWEVAINTGWKLKHLRLKNEVGFHATPWRFLSCRLRRNSIRYSKLVVNTDRDILKSFSPHSGGILVKKIFH